MAGKAEEKITVAALHPIEKQLLLALGDRQIATAGELEGETGLTEVEATRGIQWLSRKRLIDVSEDTIDFVQVKDRAFEFPERKALALLAKGARKAAEIEKPAMGWLMKRKWAEVKDGMVSLTPEGKSWLNELTADEKFYKFLRDKGTIARIELNKSQRDALELLRRRPGAIQLAARKEREIRATAAGRKIIESGIEIKKEIGQLTKEVITTGRWQAEEMREYDVTAPVPKKWPGKRHPLQMYIDKIRSIFLEMGFEEHEGPEIESAFWNFDALFQPQDHPARDLADTFYLDTPAKLTIPMKYVPAVKAMHEHGGRIESTGWQYKWKPEEARKAILRTHTTAVTVKSLASIRPPAKVFCIGRVYRNETIDYKHLAEFYQVEGIVADERVSFTDLLGYLKEFYDRMGYKKIRFRPAYFPYTEMSVEPEVYFEKKKEWIELGGAGIFRPEVTEPFGIKCPVLAWGLSLERLAMMDLGLKDIRDLYKNDLGWLRKTPRIH